MSQNLWTDAADAALREMWAQRLTARQIADTLALGARPGCTRSAVIGRVNRLGLHRSTAAEIRLAAKKRLFTQTAQRARDAKRLARRAAAQKAPPAVAPPVAEADVFAALPPRAGVTFFDLREGQCRWPCGDHLDLSYLRFCGAEAPVGESYCAAHHTLAWRPRPKKSSGPRQERKEQRGRAA